MKTQSRRSFVTRAVLAATALFGWRKAEAKPEDSEIRVCTWDIRDAESAKKTSEFAAKLTAKRFMEVVAENASSLRGIMVITVTFEGRK